MTAASPGAMVPLAVGSSLAGVASGFFRHRLGGGQREH